MPNKNIVTERKNKLKEAIREAARIPWAKDRQAVLWEALEDIASRCGVTIERVE